ncbi:hypothetical protein LZ198_07910 [Myxococcus sp. K15C18031901]|uniref:hypothetical protein n=1 Tax=Myxococcus dinghuensis TaxID=2906761 RepID=UPI0020A70C74|nr:hypothetical protein [Myxococcus dinghuensis]MCP3098798.1 hypothetical protein [Myxococcus dinghuensis]
MNVDLPRRCVFAALLAAPTLAFAQQAELPPTTPPPLLTTEEPSAPRPPRTPSDVSIAFGMSGYTAAMDSTRTEGASLIVDFERHLAGGLTVFGGAQARLETDVNLVNGMGLQAGSRLYFGDQPFQGAFVAVQLQAGYTRVSLATTDTRVAVGGLLGYAHPISSNWRLSFAAGVESSQTEREGPPDSVSPGCVLFTPCLLGGRETAVETRDALQPQFRAGAIYRF